MKINSVIKSILYFVVTAIILCIPALYNRYVLFYTDSALYLEQAIKLTALVDRPIGYGYFIRVTTWQSTMWLAIFFQGIIASLLIYHTLKTTLLNIKFKKIYHFYSICILTVFSSLSWYVSLLMPDIFTSFLVLAVFNILFGKNNTFTYILYSVLIFFLILSHMSNIPVLILIMATIWISIWVKKSFRDLRKKALLGTAIIMIMCSVTIGYLIKYNYDHYHKACLSPTSGIFFMARLIDTGVVDVYLKENCDKKKYRICEYKDKLPNWSQMFIWDLNGCFYKMGGWSNYQEEPKLIIKDILSSPKYYAWLAGDFTLATLKQLCHIRTGDGINNFTSEQGLAVYNSCMRDFPRNEFKREFVNSKQSTNDLTFETLNIFHTLTVLFSLVLIVYVASRHKLNDKISLMMITGLSGIFFNAAVCSNLSGILDRYQARVIWLIPFIAIVLFLNYLLPSIKAFFQNILYRQEI